MNATLIGEKVVLKAIEQGYTLARPRKIDVELDTDLDFETGKKMIYAYCSITSVKGVKIQGEVIAFELTETQQANNFKYELEKGEF